MTIKQNDIGTIMIGLSGPLNDATLTSERLAAIRKAAPDAELVVVRGPEEWEQRSREIASKVQVVLGSWTWHPQFKEMPNLRWFQQAGAGVNWLLKCPEIVEGDLILTNGSGVHAIPISEHILALMLILSRGIQHHMRRQMRHAWERRGTAVELEGATMGLIGVGRIGQKTAEKAKGMNMRVLGLRRNPERSVPHVDKMYGPDSLLDLLTQSDWVVLAAAMTAETTGMIGEDELKAMKASAYIINIARGPLIREKVLIEALKEGWIAGAGLDVFEQEPLAEDSPLWDMDNVVITPHFSHESPNKIDRLIAIFTENLRRYQNDEPMINVVDKRLGY